MSKNTVQAVGARASIAIGEEQIWGEVKNPTHKIAFTSESLSASEETLESEAIRGDRGRRDLIPGVLDISGDLSFEQSASGFGMLIRHVLGDYIKAPNCDGGIHGRMEVDAVEVATGHAADPRVILPLAKEHSGGFDPSGGFFAVVDRGGAGDSLRFDFDTGDTDGDGRTGHTYDEYTRSEQTHVHSVAAEQDPNDASTSPQDLAALTLYPIPQADGSYAKPEVCSIGGLIEVGKDRKRVRYVAVTDTQVTIGGQARDTVKIYIDRNDEDPNSLTIAAGDYCYCFAGFAHTAAAATDFPTNPPVSKGAWVYEYDDTAYNGVYTHHIERGRFLPEGLTVEVDRDAAVFIYTGCKGSSITWTFDTNSIVTASISLVGQKEHAMATLVEDVLPGTSADGDPLNGIGYILVENCEAFPDPATRADIDAAEITIGERTGIYYNEKTLITAADGLGYTEDDKVYKLVLSDASGAADSSAVEMFHPAGSNVDCRTPRRVQDGTIVEGNTAPLTSFESMVYINGYYEEVLSGEVSLENNLNTDKYGLGQKVRLAVVAEQSDVSASLTMEFDDGKHYNRFRNGEFFYLEFKCISEAHNAEIGTTGVLPQQYVILPRCKFDGETPQVGDRSFIQHDMPITAVMDDDYNGKDLVCILVNGLDKDVEA